MVKCSFCGHMMEPGTGKMFAKNDSSLFYYCSNKCEKNQRKLKRIPREIKWTQEFKKNRDSSNSNKK